MKEEEKFTKFLAVMIVFGVILLLAAICNSAEEDDTPKCMRGYCDNDRALGSYYCYTHKSYSGSSSSSSNKSGYSSSSSKKSSSSSSWPSYSSYDEGYDSVYENDDYDWDRYWNDSDYANGVEDAMDDLYWYGW